jgi:very-long-chain ceramide synthase
VKLTEGNLQTSKTLNYIDHPMVPPYFTLFMVVWMYLRHYINLKIIWSLFTDFKTVGPYELDWAAGQFKCELSFWITLGLLSSLQALNMFWFFYIVRIAYRIVVHNIVEDDRSDAEPDEEDEAVDDKSGAPAVEDKKKSQKKKERVAPPEVVAAARGKKVNGNGSAAAHGGAVTNGAAKH